MTGRIAGNGAVIDVLVDASRQRRRALERSGAAAPESVHVRALIDTGANISGFAPRVFTQLNLSPVGTIAVLTPSTPPTSPHRCSLYDIALSVVANGRANLVAECRVMVADCWLPGEGVEALIGRDILDRCFFQYIGHDASFTLAF